MYDALELPAGITEVILASAITGLVILMLVVLAGCALYAMHPFIAIGSLVLAGLVSVGAMYYQNILQPYGFAEFWSAISLYRTTGFSEVSLLAIVVANAHWALTYVPYFYPAFFIAIALILRKMNKRVAGK